MSKKQAQKKNAAKSKKQTSSTRKKGKGSKVSHKDELDKTRKAQANRATRNPDKPTGGLRDFETHDDNVAGPGHVQNVEDKTEQVNPEGEEAPTPPDEVARQARESGESLSTSLNDKGDPVPDSERDENNERKDEE